MPTMLLTTTLFALLRTRRGPAPMLLGMGLGAMMAASPVAAQDTLTQDNATQDNAAQDTRVLADVLEDPTARECLQQAVLVPENIDRSVAELLQECLPEVPQVDDNALTVVARAVDRAAITAARSLTQFFQPYKDNYIAFGRMRNSDGSLPFSGEKLDTKFELGLSFGPFADIEELSFLTPLRFGYSQRSWWNIADDSAPFTEHNYNPEVFWQFDQPERPLLGRPPFIDIIGFEHQSNGVDGDRSRSWDRVYIQKNIQIAPRFSVNVKLWDILATESNNDDIRRYVGSGQIAMQFHPNDRTRVRVRLMRGSHVEKISYQADIIYRRPWLNTAFFLTYYDGYGEALINYNRKSRSLRAGLYFPLEQLVQ